MRAMWPQWFLSGLLALSVIYSIHLGFRVNGLERELARMKPAKVGAAAPPLPVAADETQRLIAQVESIEDDLADLQENYATLDEQLAGGHATGGGAVDESRILDVVSRAQTRIQRRQLEFHSAQWRRTRAQIAEDFGVQNTLERWQTDQVKRLLEDEAEAAADIMARPENVENPELMANEWQGRLDKTDDAAADVLEGPAMQAWIKSRMFERQVLWPWLPSLQPQAKK